MSVTDSLAEALNGMFRTRSASRWLRIFSISSASRTPPSSGLPPAQAPQLPLPEASEELARLQKELAEATPACGPGMSQVKPW